MHDDKLKEIIEQLRSYMSTDRYYAAAIQQAYDLGREEERKALRENLNAALDARSSR